MGVPQKLNTKWLAAIEKARDGPKMEPVTDMPVFVPYDTNRNRFIEEPHPQIKYHDNIYRVDKSLLHFNQYSGRLGAYVETSKNFILFKVDISKLDISSPPNHFLCSSALIMQGILECMIFKLETASVVTIAHPTSPLYPP